MEQFIGVLIILALVITLVFTKAGIYYLLAIVIPLFPTFMIRTPGNVPIYFLDIILAIGLLKYLLLAYSDKTPREKTRDGPLLLLILVSGIVSYLVGIALLGNPVQYSTYSLVRTLLPMTCFLWAYRLFSRDRAHIGKTVSIFIASSTLMALLGIGILFRFEPVVKLTTILTPLSASLKNLLTLTELGGRLAYDMSPATAAGSFLLVPIFVIACLLVVKAKSSRRKAALLVIALTINTVALILTFSRSAILGFFFGLVVFILVAAKKSGDTVRQRGGKLAMVVVAIAALAVGTFVVQRTIERGDPYAMTYKVHFAIQGEGLEYGKESRIDRVVSSLGNMTKDPLPALLGSGMGTLTIGERTGTELAYTKYYAHNFFFVELMYWGLLGLGVFLLLYISLWTRLRQYSARGRVEDSIDIALIYSVVCIFPALLLTYFGEIAYVSLPALNALLWFLLGAGSCMAARYREEPSTVITADRTMLEKK